MSGEIVNERLLIRKLTYDTIKSVSSQREVSMNFWITLFLIILILFMIRLLYVRYCVRPVLSR